MKAIEASGLTKRYDDVTALDGVDISVEAGHLFGPNGAGKTTLLRILTGKWARTSFTE